MSDILDKYEQDLSIQKHYPTTYSNISDIIKESSYLLYDFKDVTEELTYNTDHKDVYVKEKSPLFYSRVIDNEANQELLDVLTEAVPFYYLTPSLYDDKNILLKETRDIGINNVPSMLQENDFYETWFRDAFGYIKNLLILDGYNKLRYPYINENQYLYAQVFSKLAKEAFEISVDSESRIEFNDTEEANNAVYDTNYKYYGEEIGSTDYLNDIIEKKIISNYVFIDFSSEQSNFLTNTVNSLYESGQITYSEINSEKLTFKLQEIKNELLRRKLSGTYSLYKLVLSSMNRNGSFVGVIKASDVATETNTSLTSAQSANGKRPIRLVNTPGFLTETVSEYGHSIDPIEAFYTNVEDDDKIPLDILVPLYYTSSDVKKSSPNEIIQYNNEAFYTYGYTTYEDSTKYEDYESKFGDTEENKYQVGLLRDNSNVIQLDSLEGIISQDNLQNYNFTLDSLYRNNKGDVVYRTLDSSVVNQQGSTVPYALDMSYNMFDFEMVYSNILDINADHLMYHYNSIQQKLGEYYDYLTYPIASGNGVCLMDTFWLNYLDYQLDRKTKVNDNTMIGTQINTFIDLSEGDNQAIYEFFGVSYETDDQNISLDSFKEYTPDSKFVLLWYCVINYDTKSMKINDVNKTLISKVRLKELAPNHYYETISPERSIKSEYKDCEIFTKYNVGILPFTYRDCINDKVKDIKLGFYNDILKDDAKSQGYGKALFVFSKYDITSYSPDKNIDPYELDVNSSKYSDMFTNTLCSDIKTIYYIVNKTEVESYANVTRGGYLEEDDGSIVKSQTTEKFVWSDPIRVIDMKSFFELTENQSDIHFSPDWQGLSYYLNPYLNFTSKSASSLRHKKVYQAYSNTSLEVPQTAPPVAKTVDYFVDLFAETPTHGDIYYVTKQDAYYIYDSATNKWSEYDTRTTVEGPSESAALSNLCRMRRLDFAANDSGEIAPTHWIDNEYCPEFEAASGHPAYSVYGLYLNKVQPELVNRALNFKIVSDIKGDNRQNDIFDIEYDSVEYLNGNASVESIIDPKVNTLYVITSNGDNGGKYIYVESDEYTGFIKVSDNDLYKRSSIYYDDNTQFPCISISNDYNFNSSVDDSSDISTLYSNYLKISPCSDSSLKRELIHTDLTLNALKQKTTTGTKKRAFLASGSRKLYETSDKKIYLYNETSGKFVQATDSDKIDTVLLEESKKNWYWNRESKDGLTLCFNVDLFGDNFFKEFNGVFNENEVYYYKNNNGSFYRKRPTDYPAKITGNDDLYIENFVQVEEGTGTHIKVNYGTIPGNYYFEESENGNYSVSTTNEKIKVLNGVYNPKMKYFKEHNGVYTQVYIDDYLFGKQIGFMTAELYGVTFTEVDSSSYTIGDAIPEGKYYTKKSYNEYRLCSNDVFTEGVRYYTDNDTLSKFEIDEQLSEECRYFEPIFEKVTRKSDICFSDSEYITSYFKKITLEDESSIYVQCSGTEKIGEGPYYKYIDETYEEVSLDEIGGLFLSIYVKDNNKYSLAYGKYATNDYYKIIGFRRYTVENLYGTSAVDKGYYVSSDMDSTQVLAYRTASANSVVNAEFMFTMDQIPGTEKFTFNFTVYPNGQSNNPLTCTSREYDTEYLNSKNVRLSASAYKISNSEVVMSIVVDNNVDSESLTGDFTDFPVKYSSDFSNGLEDIVLFTQLDSNGSQSHNFYGNVYDLRLYNSGKSPQELLLLNMGTMRELYSYSPSVYKLAHSIYTDLSYLRVVQNAEISNDKKVGAIRIFNRSVWDSIYVDNFPVSEEEMDPTSPQYYENYKNPLYDSDIYKMTVNGRNNISVTLDDCVEQSLMDRMEVFNGKDIQENTIVSYNNKNHLLTTDDLVTAVFSTLMPINYDNDPIVSSNLGFSLNGGTITSKTSGDYEPIKIYLPLDSSDDYFRYSADISPNFKISSDFNLAMWLSRGTNISLTYDEKLNDSYVTVLDNSKKDSNVNSIVVPLVLPKQSDNTLTGYIDMFKISNFRLSESFVKLLRATSYYDELRIPLPCYKKDYSFAEFDASNLIGQNIPNYYIKKDDNNYSPVNTGLLEQGTVYYKWNPDIEDYVLATDVRYGSVVSHYYVKNSSQSDIDRYISAETRTFEEGVQYYKYELTDVPTYYNKWDGIRVLKEGTYFTTCKYPIELMPFNDDEFDSTDKSNYATVYGSVRFKILVEGKPKDMCESEIEQYTINGIPKKYMADKIKSTLQSRSELVDPDDNRTFPHREMSIKLYALDVDSSDNLAGYMVENEDTHEYEEQYGFKWKLVASNNFYDCYSPSWEHPKSIVSGNTYYTYNETTGQYSIYTGDNPSPSTCYEFSYASTGVVYLNKETLDDCIITESVPLFMSKNFTMPFFVAGQIKTEDDESFDYLDINTTDTDSASADDDLIEPIRIRPSFNKVKTNNDITLYDEKIKATSVDDLDKIVLIAGKTYKILFDYTSKVSELAFSNNPFTEEFVNQTEKVEYCQYYSLIDSLKVLDSDYEYTTSGDAFNIPITYDINGCGVYIESSNNNYTIESDALLTTPGIPIPENVYYVKKDGKFYIATGEFKSGVSYYTKNRCSYKCGVDNDKFYFGDPSFKYSNKNALLTYATDINDIVNSYKIYYMIDVSDDMRSLYDVYNSSTPSKAIRLNGLMAFTNRYGDYTSVADFSEASTLKILYDNLINENIVSNIQSETVGIISGFTKVSPNISYRRYNNVQAVSSNFNRYVEVTDDSHELYAYESSSRQLPYKNNYDITRTTCFRNNMLKGKQLDLLNNNYWDISGSYSDASNVEDPNFGKTVVKFTDVESLELYYDGGDYLLQSRFEAAINIKADMSKISKIYVTYYDNDKNIVKAYDKTDSTHTRVDDLEMHIETPVNNIVNCHVDTGNSIKTSKVRFKFVTTDPVDIYVGKVIIRGNGTTRLSNGLANVYYNNSFVDANVIMASHLTPVFKDLQTNQYIPIQFKNGKIESSGIIRPNPGLNLAALFISKNKVSGYSAKSKISKLNLPWIRKFYYDHAGLNTEDSLEESAYFHKYSMAKDSLGVPYRKEVFGSSNDIFSFTADSDGKACPDKSIYCTRISSSEGTSSYFIVKIGNTDSTGKLYGITMDLEDDGTMSYFGNNLIVNQNNPLSVSNEALSMTYNCFDLENYRNNVSSPTVVTNVQLLDNNLLGSSGSYDNREVLYEFEYLPIIYDELIHHISFNIMIKKKK